jgi:hypothetical protein
MARGNSRAQSEARSPEVAKLREQMYQKGVSLRDALDVDPTIKALLGNEEVMGKWKELFDKKVDSLLEGVDGEGGTPSYSPGEQYIRIGNRVFEITHPDVNIDATYEDNSFSYEYGSIKGSHDPGSGWEITDQDHDFESWIKESTIEELHPDEAKKYVPISETKVKTGIDMPEVKGVNELVSYRVLPAYRDAAKKLPAFISVPLNRDAAAQVGEKTLSVLEKGVGVLKMNTPPNLSDGRDFQIDYGFELKDAFGSPRKMPRYSEAEAKKAAESINGALDVIRKLRSKHIVD